MTDKETQAPKANALESFATASLSFVRNTGAAFIEACGGDPDTELIRSNIASVENHLTHVFDFAKQQYAAGNIGIKNQIDEVLSIADGEHLALSGERTALSVAKKGIFGGGFFSWISKHLSEIKKIIRLLFGDKLPKWLDTILDLIDQLWDMIAELLSGIFGFNRREIARDISSGRVNYMNELAAVARLTLETQRLSAADED